MKAPCLTLVLFWIGAAPAPVLAGDDATPAVKAQSVDPAKLESGARVKVTGKYKELLDKELNLFDCPVPFRIQQKDLLKKILDYKAQRDNVTVTGRFQTGESGSAIEVEEIAGAPSDLEVFTREEEELLARAGGDTKELAALIKKVLTTASRFNESELLPLALRLFEESLGPNGKSLDAAAVEERIQIVRDMHKIAKDTEMALDAALRLEKRSAEQKRIQDLLRELNCRKHAGKWVTYAEFKRREGLVEQGGRWITPREKSLIDFIESLKAQKQQNLILRKRTDREYQFLSEKGGLEEGMRAEEVSVALGFPDRVERRTLDGKELDQWSYGNKSCYFLGGILIKKPEP